jgi:hypothetical protein
MSNQDWEDGYENGYKIGLKEGLDTTWHKVNKDGYVKEITDEEIIELFENPDDFNCIDFARAILRKAQEK